MTFDSNRACTMPFGRYPQDRDGQILPISWLVLKETVDSLLLLSERILDCKRYHGTTADIKWRDCVDTSWQYCDLRSWLVGVFCETAFNADEKSVMLPALACPGTDECSFADDMITLMGADEARFHSASLGKGILKALGTEYAGLSKPDGCSLYVYDKGVAENYIDVDGLKKGCSWWWLRTEGNKPSRAYFVGTGGSIRSYANVSVSRPGVRPMIRVKASLGGSLK